ncbi:MAG: assimilatory sulfite reductase (NADPH) flavoprotein subunit [Thermomonas sp.]
MSLPATTLPTPLQPDTAAALARLAEGLDSSALLWASGYLAGMARALPANAPAPVAAVATQPATIVYGSQTGNAKRAAEALLAKLQSANLPARLLRADAYPLRELADETLLYVVVSTQGDGDPPDDARAFLDFIEGRRAPALKKLKFAVLALGDSSYPQFCAIGRRIDQRLQALGGERIADCADADLDVETVSTPWTDSVARIAGDLLKPAAPLATVTTLRPLVAAVATHSRAKPFASSVLANQRITLGPNSKDVRHIELALDGSGLSYEPGDALGVWPRNPQPLVDAVLQATSLDGDTEVRVGDEALPLRGWLLGKRELTRVARPFLAALAERSGDGALSGLLHVDNAAALSTLLANQQAIDLLQRHRADWDAASLVAALRPLQPRLYSIASSRKVVGDEAHLTVAHVEYDTDGETRWGAASHLLASREEGETLPVYIEANERFRLPADSSRDIIMIGAGTGIAPFRGFVHERGAVGGNGRNWLFFGAPHQRSDFLYQLEWQRALKDGQLDRIDLAFSRDSAPKTYVQQRIAEQALALYDWLQGGAHLYVCGAIAMAKDVHAALLDVVATHNGDDRETATEFLDTLAREGRYARDVY